ncbi:MAG: hypothetical protein QXL94_00125 [Candidatus Parvarchaeum sp.]
MTIAKGSYLTVTNDSGETGKDTREHVLEVLDVSSSMVMYGLVDSLSKVPERLNPQYMVILVKVIE